MTWARARLDLHPGRRTCKQLSASCIETKDHDFVRSQIARVSELVSWIQHYAVCMRSFLSVSVYARALILFHVCSCAQTSVALDREDRNVSSSVIRNQNKPAGAVHVHITRIGAQRCLLIQQSQVACSLIDDKGADGPA